MKIRDLSIWHAVAVILAALFIISLMISVQCNDYRPVLLILLGANILLFLKFCLDYFDYSRISFKSRIYRDKKPSDILLNFRNTKYYLDMHPVRVEADGAHIADISKGRNAVIPIPKNTQRLTLSMKKVPNTVELTEFSPDVCINTWIKYSADGSKELMTTVTAEDQRFNEKPLFKMYAQALKLRQDNAVWCIFVSAIPMIVLIVFLLMPLF